MITMKYVCCTALLLLALAACGAIQNQTPPITAPETQPATLPMVPIETPIPLATGALIPPATEAPMPPAIETPPATEPPEEPAPNALLPPNHWNVAFYIITNNVSVLHRPALHDDLIDHGTIPDTYLPAIKDRAHRFAAGLHNMSNGNIKMNVVFYLREDPVYIITTEDISIMDIFTDKSFFHMIDETNQYDFIMIIHGNAYYGAGSYLLTLDNAVATHIGFSMFLPHWLDATFISNPNDRTPGDLLPVDMFGVTWDFFTYLLLHEFLHALEDQARGASVAFPLIHNDNGMYWDRVYGIGIGYHGADYLWSTEQRLPYYYAILNGRVPTRENPNIKWGFTPDVFLRNRTHN